MWYLETLHTDAAKILEPNSKKKMKKIKNLQQKDDHELFDYVHCLIRSLPIFSVPSTPYYRKSNEKCDHFRREGNELFVRNFKWKQALFLFTKSVAHAEIDSESLSLAYSNRSHVFLDRRFYNECVQDIERALKCKYPENLKRKLLLRREKIEEFKRYHKTVEYHDIIPEPSPKNKLIEMASNSITVNTDEKWGEHIVAKRDIRIGEVVLVEAPYISQTDNSCQYMLCDECMEFSYSMIPCDNCTEVMYCGEECKNRAYNTYHKYECVLIQHGLIKKRLFLRLTLKALLEYDRFQEDLSKNDPVFRSGRYKEINELRTFKQSKTPKELFEAALEPIAFYHFLTKYTDILHDLKFDNKERIMKELLLRNYMIIYSNTFSIEMLKPKTDSSSYFQHVGVGVFPFYSKFHHSCFSNTVPIYYGSKVSLRALSNIKKGEHVTTTFGLTFLDRSRIDRAMELQKYNYICHCEACIQDWPMQGELRLGTPVPKTLERKVAEFLTSWAYGTGIANQLLSDCFKFYNTLKIPEVPTLNYVRLRYLIFDLMRYLGNSTVE